MKTILLLLSLMFSLSAFAQSEDEVRVATKIKKLVPRLSDEKVNLYSNLIVFNAKKHSLDPMVLTAIIKQESTFRNTTTYVKKKDLSYFEPIVKDISIRVAKNFDSMNMLKVASDIGIMQVNVKTAEDMGFNVELLKTSVAYQIEVGTEILAMKMRMCQHKEETPWACYHSKTPQHFLTYQKDVKRWLD